MTHGVRSGGFVAYYRRYTKTWLHALSTAALTIFGILTFVHTGFAAAAVAAYVLPPVVLYAAGLDPAGIGSGASPSIESEPDADATADPESVGEGREDRDESEFSEDRGDRPARWTAVETPTDATLLDAALADDRAFVAGDGGVVLADEGEGWRVALEDGPGADGNALRGADATGDGRAVWVAGDGGALGRLDAATGRHVDHSAPRGITDNWTDVAAGGTSGDETVLLVNGSGELLRGRYRDGEVAWDAPTKPGSGSSISGVALDDGGGFLCDTNDGVFETTDGGETVRRIGLDGADGTLTDVAVVASGDPAVSADDGVVHRYDAGNWTPVRVGDDPLRALAFDGDRGVACGDDGVVSESPGGVADWERVVTPATGTLRGVAVEEGRAVAVGDGGTVVERG